MGSVKEASYHYQVQNLSTVRTDVMKRLYKEPMLARYL